MLCRSWNRGQHASSQDPGFEISSEPQPLLAASKTNLCGVFWDPTLKTQDYVNSPSLQSGVVCSLNKQVHGTLVQQQQWIQQCSQPSVVAFLSSLGSSSYLSASLSVTPFLFSQLVLPEPPYFICDDSPSTLRCSEKGNVYPPKTWENCVCTVCCVSKGI